MTKKTNRIVRAGRLARQLVGEVVEAAQDARHDIRYAEGKEKAPAPGIEERIEQHAAQRAAIRGS